MDNRTLFVLLIIGYAANMAFLLSYGERRMDRPLKYHLFFQAGAALTYFCFLSRVFLPLKFSALLGGGFSSVSLILESLAVMSLLGPFARRSVKAIVLTSLLGFVTYALGILLNLGGNARILVYDVAPLLLIPYPSLRLLTSKEKTKARTALGILLALLFFAFVARTIEAAFSREEINLFSPTPAQTLFYLTQFLYMLLSGVGILLASKEQTDKALYKAATRDPLTGVLNRGAFEEMAWKSISMCARNDIDYTLMLFDLDNFKKINDLHGHHVGDAVLKDFAAATTAKVRNYDHFGRYGGDEFILLLQSVDSKRLEAITARLQAQATHPLFGDLAYTVSAGALCVRHPKGKNLSLEELTIACDKALYEAKALGPGTFVVHEQAKEPVFDFMD